MWNTLITLLTNLVMGYSVSEPVKIYEVKAWHHVYDCLGSYMEGLICGMLFMILIIFGMKLVKSITEK